MNSDTEQALNIARRLIGAGIPVFAAPPCPAANGGECTRPGHTGKEEYDLPAKWQLTVPSEVWLEKWRPGWALGAVGGHVADFLDEDPRHGGDASITALMDAGQMPRVFGIAETPSGGRHYLISPLHEGETNAFMPGLDYQGGLPDGKSRAFVWIAPTVKRSKDPANLGQLRPYRWTQPPDLDYLADFAGSDDTIEGLRDRILSSRTRTRSEPASGGTAPSGDRAFTEAEARKYCRATLSRLQDAQIGEIEERANAAACQLSHFVPEFWSAERAYDVLLNALSQTAYDPDGPSSWTAEKFLPVLDGRRPPAGDWKASLRAERAVDTGGELVEEDVLPSPQAPAKVARVLAERMERRDGVTCVKWWQDDFYRWTGTHWGVYQPSLLERWLYEQTEHAGYIRPADQEDEEAEVWPWNPSIKKVQEVTNALAKLVLQHEGEQEAAVACINGVVDLEKRVALPHTPTRFNLSSLPFEFDPTAECPRWRQFMDESLPGDTEAHDFLAEWFGYVLAGRTDQQKIASLIGKRRGGKGTIARILTAMVGRDATTAPDITDLGSHFGRASLIGKSLATMSDVRWNSNLSSEALKTFLTISGEDVVTIPRKHREDWTGRSGLRFMVLSNDVPQFADRSNAIGSRMIHVKFDVTFEGREDFALEGKLMAELPGILNWALDGLHRLSERGRFTVPASGQVIAQQMEESSNPVRTFLEDLCELKEGASVEAVALLEVYSRWADRRRMKPMELRTFLTALRHVEGVSTDRVKVSGQRRQVVQGVSCESADPFALNTAS